MRRLRGDDALARRIARQGEARIDELLREEHLVGYVRDLIREYRGLMVHEEEGAPSAVRLYHRYCGAGKAHFCSHARPGRPPKFDDRSR